MIRKAVNKLDRFHPLRRIFEGFCGVLPPTEEELLQRRQNEIEAFAQRIVKIGWLHWDDRHKLVQMMKTEFGGHYVLANPNHPSLAISVYEVLDYADQHLLEFLPESACESLQPKLNDLRNGRATLQTLESPYPL